MEHETKKLTSQSIEHFKSQIEMSKIENYFAKSGNTLIDFKGDSFHFQFENGNLEIADAENGDYCRYGKPECSFHQQENATERTTDKLNKIVIEQMKILMEVESRKLLK